MVVIGGLARKRHPIVAVQDICPLCRREAVRVGLVEKRAIHIFWIPVIPLGSVKRFVCLMCGGEQKVRALMPPPGPEIPPAELRARFADLSARQSATDVASPPPSAPPPSAPPSTPPPLHPR